MLAALSIAPAALGVLPRAAIVTGGTRGIGRSIARQLARDGFALLLAHGGGNATAVAAAASELRAAGAAVACAAGDLASPLARARLFEVYDARFGATHELGALVHCAGQYVGVTSGNARGLRAAHGAFGDASDASEKWTHMRYYFDLYGEGYAHLCELALQRMRDAGDEGCQGGGALVGISSPGCSLQYKPNKGYDLPGSGKSVMEYASRLIALRVAPRGISCNVVVPGVTDTGAWDAVARARAVDKGELMGALATSIAPMGPTTPAQVADVVAFLCSPRGRVITGMTVPADGGVHLRI